MARLAPIAVGAIALLATLAIICVHVIIVTRASHDSSARIVSITSAALEAAAFGVLSFLYSTYIFRSARELWSRCLGILFGIGILVCILAAAASAVNLVCLDRIIGQSHDEQQGINWPYFRIGSSVALAITLCTQILFLVLQFISARATGRGQGHTNDDWRSPNSNIKSIAYTQTVPGLVHTQEMESIRTQTTSPPRGRKPTARVASVFKTTLSKAIHPVSSRTRLLPPKEPRRPLSVDSSIHRSSGDDTFESWDTSAVDVHNRQVVAAVSSPTSGKTRWLETIPASPGISRTPSPGISLDLEPPRILRRSRSYSPATAKSEPDSESRQSSSSELHIHPLFRSDSPDPPPRATPGTVVMASPNAGQLIAHPENKRSMSRIRSGSLPAYRSPLSRHSSFEKGDQTESGGDDDINRPLAATRRSHVERKMTPPVPDWLLAPKA